MSDFSGFELNAIAVLVAVRITLILLLAWLVRVLASSRNPNIQIMIWRFAIVFVLAATLVTVAVPTGWGPGLYQTELELLNHESTNDFVDATPDFLSDSVALVKNEEWHDVEISDSASSTVRPTSTAATNILSQSSPTVNWSTIVVSAVVVIYFIGLLVLSIRLLYDWFAVQRVLAGAFLTDATHQSCLLYTSPSPRD